MKFKAISYIISILLGFTSLGLGANIDKSIGLPDKASTTSEAEISENTQETKDSTNVEVPVDENILPLNNDVTTETAGDGGTVPSTPTNETPQTPTTQTPTPTPTPTQTTTPTQTPEPTPAPAPTTNDNSGTTATEGDYLAKVEDEIFTATNNERAKAGLQPLTRNNTANGYARSKSLEMLNLNYFDHKSPTNGYISDIAKRDGWKYSRVGENIYTMTGSSASSASGTAINNSWMNSPGHKANILNKDYKEIGIGVTYRNNKLYATQIFYTA
ncbi:CAP domain-containing protein [Clostridium vincentii]|uniref:Cysteine-rich secretory protein family protein n=1 Tax=Clostridium vincentii TaxID=52704 RepID=A0A2T0BBQ4_9CLOT|nr:CAP domain-containing protein [Clostridium vincentii]PRR81331.1 Cysteine-rich secretory protein family protein [Clostridium vincentii]